MLDAIELSVSPAGSPTIIDSSTDGLLATDKTGLGLKLTWKDGLPVSLSDAQPILMGRL